MIEKTNNKSITVYLPATTANIGPGYDVWGLSLKLYNIFYVEYKSKLVKTLENCSTSEIQFIYSKNVQSLFERENDEPLDVRNNLFIKCYEYLFQRYNKEPIPITVRAEINVPLQRGLGSSATAVVGGLIVARYILEQLYEETIHEQELLELAVQLEGHPDNVAPCLLGGFVISMNSSNGKVLSQKCVVQAPVVLIGLVPKIAVSTRDTRKLVATSVSLDILTFHTSRTAIVSNLLQKSIWSGEDVILFQEAMKDKVHENQRSVLIPGMLETFSYWKEIGCLSPFLSGSGSTLLGFWHKDVDYSSLKLDLIYKEIKIDTYPIYFRELYQSATFWMID